MTPAAKSKATEYEQRVMMASNHIPGSPAQASNRIKKQAGSSASESLLNSVLGTDQKSVRICSNQETLCLKKYTQHSSQSHQNPPKVDLGRPPEQSRNTIQAKNRSESESFGPAPPCEDEKGIQNELQIHQKLLPNSDMSCTPFSEAFWVYFEYQKPRPNRSRNHRKLFAAR